jgi:hypothetical protein
MNLPRFTAGASIYNPMTPPNLLFCAIDCGSRSQMANENHVN